MTHRNASARAFSIFPALTIGLDLGDRFSYLCCLDSQGLVVQRDRVATTRTALEKYCREQVPLVGDATVRVVIEAGTHSPWVSEFLEELGYEVLVANPRTMLQPGGKRRRKSDRIDAESLARVGRMDARLLSPLRHRNREARTDLTAIRARAEAVSARTKLINAVRGQIKTNGHRLVGCSTNAFHKRVPEQIPDQLKPALMPLVQAIEALTATIKVYDRHIDQLATTKYAETQRLTQVAGVGNLTALAYVLTLEDHRRFTRSRSVGPFLGLVPRQFESGDSNPQLRISKAGDVLVRRLLVTAAHYILGPMNQVDSDLQRFGAGIGRRGGKNARKKAVVAVARRLAVLLHALWRSGEAYDPLRQANTRLAKAS